MRQTSYREDQNRLIIPIIVQVNEENRNGPVVVGDILANLRAALDHPIYGHAAARTTRTPQQEKSMYFPILTDFGEMVTRTGQLGPLVDPAVLAVIDQSQPFDHPQQEGGPDWHPLAVLNGLVNHDKHRSVQTVSYVNEDFTVTRIQPQVLSVETGPIELTTAPRERQ